MLTWLQQLFCCHEWVGLGDVEYPDRVESISKCLRCGKIEVRTGWGVA